MEPVVGSPVAMAMPTFTQRRSYIASAISWECDTSRRGLVQWSIEPRCGVIRGGLGMPMVPWVVRAEAARVAVAIRDARAAPAARRDAKAMGDVPIVLAVPQ